MYVEKMAQKHIQTRVADTKHFDSDPGPFTFGFRSESEFLSPKLKSFGTQKIKFLPKFSTGTGTNAAGIPPAFITSLSIYLDLSKRL